MSGPMTYGEEGERWPVQLGEWWAAGRHTIYCGDIETEDGFAAVTRIPSANGTDKESPMLYYIDPPYTPALASGYRTKAGRPRKVNFDGLLTRILMATQSVHRTGTVLMEMGASTQPRFVRLALGMGARVVREWPITYYKKHGCFLNLIQWPHQWGRKLAYLDFSGMDDEETPELAIQAFTLPNDLVVDTCTGRGLTAVMAERYQRRFVGLELSPYRLSVALCKLADEGATPVMRLEE